MDIITLLAIFLTVFSATTQKNLSVEQEFRRRSAELCLNEKDTPRKKLNLLEGILSSVDPGIRSAELSRLCGGPASKDYHNLLAQVFVETLLKSGDQQTLRVLLRQNCPDYVASMPLEWVLATSTNSEAILLLPRAYLDGASKTAGPVLIRCLSRAFPALRKSDQSEKIFAESCKIWLRENQHRCVLNFNYSHLPGLPATFGKKTQPEELGLLVIKASQK
jgi:hypothetical protein